jgi:hypothetical protein
MDDDKSIPRWIEVLARPPLDSRLSDDQIIAELRERLSALFERYGFDAEPSECPEIVLGMARDYILSFKIRQNKKLPVSGAPIKALRWAVRAQAIGELRKLERGAAKRGETTRGLTRKAAENVYNRNSKIEARARRTHRDNPQRLKAIIKTPSVKTIQNLMISKIPFPSDWEPDPADIRAMKLLWIAAGQLRNPSSR